MASYETMSNFNATITLYDISSQRRIQAMQHVCKMAFVTPDEVMIKASISRSYARTGRLPVFMGSGINEMHVGVIGTTFSFSR